MEGNVKMASMPQESPSHSVWRSTLLHLTPGVLILLIYVASASILVDRLPSVGLMAALSLAIVLALIPLELGCLLFVSWREHRRVSLRGVVLYRQPIHLRDSLLLVPLLIWAVLCFGILSPPIEAYLQRTVFSWWPEWLVPSALDTSVFFESPVVGMIGLVSLSLQGFVGPIVEELYFRGYLLPRLSHLKGWAPLINTVLFSLYHLFTPWQNPARIAALLPLIYLVQRKRSIYLSIVFHVFLNLVGPGVLAFLAELG